MTGRTMFLSHTAQESGAELALLRLASALHNDGDELLVVFTEDGPVAARLAERCVPTRVMKTKFASGEVTIGGSSISLLRGVAQMIGTGWRLGARVRQSESSVVVAESTKALLMATIATRRARVPLIWHIHDRVSTEYFGRWLAIAVRLFGWLVSSGYIANSHSTLSSVWCRGRRTVVAYPGIDLREVVGAAQQREPDDVRIAMVGRLTEWKGQDLFLQSLAAAHERPQAVLVGGTHFGEEAYQQKLIATIDRLGLGDRVRLLGHVQDPLAAMADSDILVHFSRIAEPFGQVIVEGMASGCAVIAARAGGPAEIVRDDVDGVLVDNGDLAALTAAIDRLVTDQPLRLRLGRAGRQRAQEFTVSAAADAVRVLLGDITGRRRS